MTWLKQLAVIVLGCSLAGVMILLGVWQLRVYTAQGAKAAAARAAAPPVPLADVAPAGAAVGDGYGRSVSFRGRYLAEDQLLVPLPGQTGVWRVLTALQLEDGLVLPVVRGTVDGPSATAPPPPSGSLDQTGVLLPSEDAPDGTTETGRLGSVRVPTLAQRWPALRTDGYVMLSPADAAAQGLKPVTMALPEARGRLRNGAYALQWWVFAAFAVGMGVKVARDFGRRDELVDEPVVSPR